MSKFDNMFQDNKISNHSSSDKISNIASFLVHLAKSSKRNDNKSKK